MGQQEQPPGQLLLDIRPSVKPACERIEFVSESPLGDVRAGGQAIVTVRGEAAIRTEPDEAFVWITLAATEPTPGPALSDVAKRSEALVALLNELAIAAEDRSTAGITVREEYEHTQDGRRSVGHYAASSVSVRVSNTQLIGTLVMRCSSELDARIAGPSWRVSASNPAWLEAAAAAARNARDKAAAYADGLDLQLGPLRALAEPDDGRQRNRPLARASAAAAGQDLPIETGELEVTARIEATFALLQPS
jgi:uncharacterized protein YggE